MRRACGFIEVQSPPGKRFFAHKSEFEFQFADVDGPPLGITLSFAPGNDPKSGKERATFIRPERYGGAHMGRVGHMGPMPPMYSGAPYGHGQPRLYGILCEWSDQKACGFIECSDPAGKRFFAHKSEFLHQFPDGHGPPVGTPMTFILGTDPKSGKQRAQEIQLEHVPGRRMGHHMGRPMRPQMVPYGPPRLYGTLLDWHPQKACGFIQCFDPAGKKFFAHKSEFAVPFADGQEPPVGTAVSFVPGVDAKSGRERAQDIQPENDEAFRLYGSLIDWKDEKACGFIACSDPPGKRFFAHKSEFAEPFPDDSAPVVGTEVSFMPGVDAKSGKERAQDIRLEQGTKRKVVVGGGSNGPGRKRVRPTSWPGIA